MDESEHERYKDTIYMVNMHTVANGDVQRQSNVRRSPSPPINFLSLVSALALELVHHDLIEGLAPFWF